MKALIQRVCRAQVDVNGETVGSCGRGFMILFCACAGDTENDLDILIHKTVNLRIFEDETGKMNRSLLDVGGEVLCISQFTLAADTRKGNRPSFINAMEPEKANEMYGRFCAGLLAAGAARVETGKFGADMQVSLINDGPVTVMLDTEIWCKK